MAKSRFEYVRNFEQTDSCLLNCWIVVRIDGKAFHRFSKDHNFTKPNDERSLQLMNKAAECVMQQHLDIWIAYGQSDEFSFVFKKDTKTYNRRASKLISTVASHFASSYTFYWPNYFPQQPLLYPPIFDSRVILYPTDRNLRDYLSWRQADCHINNLYNTCFWKLVLEKGVSCAEAQKILKDTVSKDKHEMLFTQFNCNYNNEKEMFKKGSTLLRRNITPTDSSAPNEVQISSESASSTSGDKSVPVTTSQTPVVSALKSSLPYTIDVLFVDIIKDAFWKENCLLTVTSE